MMSTLAVGMLSYVQINLTTEKKRNKHSALFPNLHVCSSINWRLAVDPFLSMKLDQLVQGECSAEESAGREASFQ